MRILHIVGTLDPASGGPAEAIRLLVRYASADVVSEIVTLDEPDAPFLKDFPCVVHALGGGGVGFAYNKALVPWLKANRERFDGVVMHGLWSYAGDAARRALAGRVPYVVFVHGMLDPYFKRAFPAKHAKKWPFWVLSQYWTLRRAAYALFTTEEEAKLAQESFWLHRWTPAILPLGTEALAEATVADHEAFYALVPEVRGKRFLLFLGRIHPKKGVDLLVDAFVSVAGEDRELELVVAGPESEDTSHGAWLAGLREVVDRAGVAPRIHWPGMVKGEGKRGAFDLCEAFVLTSHQENFGVAVAEALSAGKPVLISDKINIASEIANAGAGFVETDTVEGARKLLRRWLGLSEKEREEMRVKAARMFAETYDMRANAAVLERLFKGMKRP